MTNTGIHQSTALAIWPSGQRSREMGRFLRKYVISDVQRISSQTRALVHLDPCFLVGVLFCFVCQ